MAERRHTLRQPDELRVCRVRPTEENRADRSSDSATCSLIAEKLGCSHARFANGASKRSATPETGPAEASPTKFGSRSWSGRTRNCARPTRS